MTSSTSADSHPRPISDDSPEEPSPPSPNCAPKSSGPSESDDPIDNEVFQQILELDEEGDSEFSRGMVFAYFDQAIKTFDDMAVALKQKDLVQLSSLGHFLKGSSAAIGVQKVQASCEHIQHVGKLRDEENNKDLTPEEALARIANLLEQAKKQYRVAKTWLDNYYDKPPLNS